MSHEKTKTRALNRRRRYGALLGLIAMAGCGGGGDPATGANTPTAASVAVSGAGGTLTSIGATQSLTASVRDANQAAITNATVSWTTSNAAVATVSGSGATATVTATGNGTATITAQSGTASGNATVTVAQQMATLTVGAPNSSPAIGATVQLTAAARDARGNAIAGVTGVTFTTSDRSKALVDANGLVTAISPGAVTINASLTRDGVTANGSAALTVASPVTGVSSAAITANPSNQFVPPNATITEGGTVAWTFGTLDHNVIFQAAGAPADIPVTANSVVSRVFNTAGAYPYVCSLHAGMSGTVTVLPGGIVALLNGAAERPNPVNTTANGAAVFTRSGGVVTYVVTYQGIASIPTGAHIHAPATATTTAGIIVDLVKQTLTSNSGVISGTFTASDIRPIGGQPAISLDSLMTLLRSSSAYVNVHSTTFPAGEIRGMTGPP
jgi:plastocyanin